MTTDEESGIGGVVAIATTEDPTPLERTHDDSASPMAGWIEVGSIAGAAVGLWEHTVGVSDRIEEDEIFIVLSGRCTVTEVGMAPVHFGPGDIGRLTAGARTRWEVHETIRKAWVAGGDEPHG